GGGGGERVDWGCRTGWGARRKNPRSSQRRSRKKKRAEDAHECLASAWDEEEHVNRLRDLCGRPASDLSVLPRRGPARQRRQREREHHVRNRVVELAQWGNARGWTRHEIADRLQLAPRTMRQWQFDRCRPRRRLLSLGRPTCCSSPGQRNAVIALLAEVGPAIGVPTLFGCFPWRPRRELADLLQRYRRVWRRRHRQALHVLHWQVPGSVWAMDFSEKPWPIDGLYRYLLAVRDLASGQQLLWQPV